VTIHTPPLKPSTPTHAALAHLPTITAASAAPAPSSQPRLSISGTARVCYGCQQLILGGEYVSAAGRVFHKEHFLCSLDKQPLSHGHYRCAGALFLCDGCTAKQPDCFVCSLLCVAAPGEPAVVSLGEKDVAHSACFQCSTCSVSLIGQPIAVDREAHKLYCAQHAKDSLPSGKMCVGCGDAICGRVLHAVGEHWHPRCFVCCTCLAPLEAQAFLLHEETSSVYCKPCYEQAHAPKCTACQLPLQGTSVTLAGASDVKLHPECVRCSVCQCSLADGNFHQDPDAPVRLFCRQHFDSAFVTEQCDACAQTIAASEAPLRVMGRTVHQACFHCATCKRSLAACAYGVSQQQFFCEEHLPQDTASGVRWHMTTPPPAAATTPSPSYAAGSVSPPAAAATPTPSSGASRPSTSPTNAARTVPASAPVSLTNAPIVTKTADVAPAAPASGAAPPAPVAAAAALPPSPHALPPSTASSPARTHAPASAPTPSPTAAASNGQPVTRPAGPPRLPPTVASVLAAGTTTRASFAGAPGASGVSAAAAASAPASVPVVPVREEIIRLVDGDIPASSLGAFISRGIQVTIESTRTGSSASEARGSNAGGDYLKKELHALMYSGHSFSLMTYAPRTFERVRTHYGISNESFIRSLVTTPPQGGAVGEGKSGMLFYFSVDRKFVLKTVKKEELHFFRYMLKQYTEHMTELQPHSLLPRFFALVKIKYNLKNPDGSAGAEKTFRLVVMNNLFDCGPGINITQRFDLKGSTRNRHIPPEKQTPGRVLLDLNWNEQGLKLCLGPQQKALFLAQVKADAAFLRAQDVMDHSLLLGIHEDDDAQFEQVAGQTELDAGMGVDAGLLAGPLLPDSMHPRDGGLVTAWQQHRGGVRAFDAGTGGPGARTASTPRREVYYCGIIDILQRFDAKKKLESAYKSIRFNKASISAIESKAYNERFVAYLDQISC